MTKHDWACDTDGNWTCDRAGCTVRKSPDSPVWQRKKGAHWRKTEDETIPECKGAESSTVEVATDHTAAVDASNHGRGTLTPRQALGEALACVERARALLLPLTTTNTYPAEAMHSLAISYVEVKAAYEAAK